MKVCIPVTDQGQIDRRWGKAPRLAVVEVTDGQIGGWQEYDVEWDRLHDEGTHGSHHARVVRFLLTHEIEMVIASHMGPPMLNTLQKMGIHVVLDAAGDARAAIREVLTLAQGTAGR